MVSAYPAGAGFPDYANTPLPQAPYTMSHTDLVQGKVPPSPELKAALQASTEKILVIILHGMDASVSDRNELRKLMADRGGIIVGGVKNQPNFHVRFPSAGDAEAVLKAYVHGKGNPSIMVGPKVFRLHKYQPEYSGAEFTLTLSHLPAETRDIAVIPMLIRPWGTPSNPALYEESVQGKESRAAKEEIKRIGVILIRHISAIPAAPERVHSDKYQESYGVPTSRSRASASRLFF
eukprot:jgi/Mesvir1/19375/Mv10417-RA.1